ncbi:competence type IV pilus major pilin ComGC [Fictibacillus sp. Mic-4]|uniref:competence type IV pilus major pilin ComGC n=1 Tax=Fictibacillus TaxID=1329200 RepID=UPI000422368E|nr:competence type IV pilus major pilin ComGC [Fictibacillus gelatini]
MKLVKKEDGFTLIEMTIVLLIISILLLIVLPSMAKNNKVVKNVSCKATVDLVQGQVGAYEADKGKPLANLQDLVDEGYVDHVTCPDGSELIFADGIVKPPAK